MIKNLSAMWEAWVQSLGWEDTLDEGMATHSSILAWKIPEELAGYSLWGCKESDMTRCTHTCYVVLCCMKIYVCILLLMDI